MPEVYASWPWLRTEHYGCHAHTTTTVWMALDVLHEEIINNLGGAPKVAKVVQPMACFSVPSLSSFGGQAGEVSASDGTTKSLHVPPMHTTLSGPAQLNLVSISTASFTKLTIQFIFLWLWFQVQKCISDQYFRLIRVITIRIPCWVSCQLLGMFRC